VFNTDDDFFSQKRPPTIPESAKVIFVSDMFVEDYTGGAELTSEALIKASPIEVFKLRSRDVTMTLLQQGADRFWIFGNFTEVNAQLIPTIVANLKYSVVEYDYKYCRFRSPEKHLMSTGYPCDCSEQMNGKLISAFFHGSMGIWWMSQDQKERYHKAFPFLADKNNTVLSSVFEAETLGKMKLLRETTKERDGKWIVLGSNSWVKGAPSAEKWCKDNGKDYDIVWNLPYAKLLARLSAAEGFVYLPEGADTCPRMVIEAKLLGCKTVLNDNVQHAKEEWFDTDDLESIEDYLYVAPTLFWNGIKNMMVWRPKISGYTTTYNCEAQGYPFRQCIESMLGFCEEVCVVDGGSTDRTWSTLQQMALGYMVSNPDGSVTQRLKVKQVPRDWSHPRHAVFDGMQKAEAREMCTGDFCWQMDSDEVVHEQDYEKVAGLCRMMPKEIDIVSLPVIEYWGGPEKVRADIQPWKWRLSRNSPLITHGIPVQLRSKDAEGNLIALPGTDGCDPINKLTGEPLHHLSFFPPEVDQVRRAALTGNVQALSQYEQWFNNVVNQLPCVFHYSWYDLPRKIRLYRDYWTQHWVQLHGGEYVDSAEQNMMFDVPWSEVTEEMIEKRAAEFAQMGGWIWHRKWDGTKTPWITCNRSQPRLMINVEREKSRSAQIVKT
jgi:hypothetical protein